jgi:hypothetical protein
MKFVLLHALLDIRPVRRAGLIRDKYFWLNPDFHRLLALPRHTIVSCQVSEYGVFVDTEYLIVLSWIFGLNIG